MASQSTKSIIVIAALVAAAGVGYSLFKQSGQGADQATPPGGEGTPNGQIWGDATPDMTGGTSSPEAVAQPLRSPDEALAQLAASSAKDWVLANRSMETDTDKLVAIVEVRMLSALDRILDGEKMSLGEVTDLATSESELRWAVDANLDGELDEQEMATLKAAMDRFNPMNNTYVQAKIDSNRDGAISQDEAMSFQRDKAPAMMEALATLGRVPMQSQMDRDADGTVSDDERRGFFQLADVIKSYDLDGDGVLSVAEERGPFIAAAQVLTMRIAERKLSAVGVQMPQVQASFANADADGNGQLSEGEIASARQRWAAERDRIMAITENGLLRYDATTFDRDGNGNFSSAERLAAMEGRHSDIRNQIAMMTYDSDRNDKIDPTELQAYATWFRAKAPRADANLDGEVTDLDFEFLAQLMMR